MSSITARISSGVVEYVSPTTKSFRRKGIFDILFIDSFAKMEFGMEITVFGNVRTRVERIPIASTTPSTFPAIIQSPIANGLSATRETEPKKLAIVSFEANAKAAPPIPKDARTALTLAPHKSNSIKRSIISRDILNNLRPKSIIFIAAEGRLKNLAVIMSNIKSPIIAIIQNINKFKSPQKILPIKRIEPMSSVKT